MEIKVQVETRVTKQWWASADGEATFVTGYRCDPNMTVWWCPAVGYSLTEGGGLFESEAAALDDAIKEVRGDLKAAEKQLEKLELRRLKLLERIFPK